MAKGRRANRRRTPVVFKRQKKSVLTERGIHQVDYKDVQLLRTFISERGKIRSRRVTGLTVQQQRDVANAIKNAREMALLPYSAPQ